jgi:hypothetical protein
MSRPIGRYLPDGQEIPSKVETRDGLDRTRTGCEARGVEPVSDGWWRRRRLDADPTGGIDTKADQSGGDRKRTIISLRNEEADTNRRNPTLIY